MVDGFSAYNLKCEIFHFERKPITLKEGLQ